MTAATTRFTISLPTSLLRALDEQLVNDGESRSAAVRRLLEEAVRAAQERADVERYIRGYRELPQTEEELGWSGAAAREHLSELPWK
jgi:metal-responsive CopG/Arc/MetJ family transcriptional regulator